MFGLMFSAARESFREDIGFRMEVRVKIGEEIGVLTDFPNTDRDHLQFDRDQVVFLTAPLGFRRV